MKKLFSLALLSLSLTGLITTLLPAKAYAIPFGIVEFQPCGNGAANCWDVLLENGKLVRVTG